MSPKDGFDKLHEWYVDDDPLEAVICDEERDKSKLAEEAYRLRMHYKLSLEELSGLTGIAANEIDDLEEGDYLGSPRRQLFLAIKSILRSRCDESPGGSSESEPKLLSYGASMREND